jgi:hypothetical protein
MHINPEAGEQGLQMYICPNIFIPYLTAVCFFENLPF